MIKMLVAVTLALAAPAFAGETTVTLAVRNWYCAACPHVVKESLAAVPGVTNVAVSDKTKTAVVTFDDAKADVKALIKATTEAGYPSFPYAERDAMAMKDRDLIAAGVVAVVAAVCCATPAVIAAIGAIGLTAWLAKVGNVLIPALILGAWLIGFGLYRKQHRER